MNKDVQLAGRKSRASAHPRPWFLAGFLGLVATWTAAGETADAARQGITVHGNWTITVSDSEGREVSTRHFRNALLPSGEFLLVRLLTFGSEIDNSLSSWRILVGTSGTVDSAECNALTGLPIPVDIGFDLATRASLTLNDARTAFTLERDLKLPATCISGASYSISEVWSAAQYKVNSPGPFPDPAFLLPKKAPFTMKTLDSAVVVLPGQVVSLSVTFSFS
ncbi:MAG: hypothetical protein NXH81_12785 [Halieaceae bacterium]|uniref:hypothetical protein n=1 Tax=Haliea alexandrii TaxID=2448162 RepID=UPI001304D9F3|nr:hypothetical protein [Haliea alexandrii]MCR9186267.1 hypothetical protein [Halieaceae bacterium]